MAELVFIRPEGDRSHVEILVNENHTFTVDVYENDLPCALDSSASKVQVLKPGGASLVAKTTATVGTGLDGSTNNRLTYQLTDTDENLEDYVLVWFAVRNGETEEHEHRVLFDICYSKLFNTVREEDLFEYAPTLKDARVYFLEGTADSGTTTTLVDAHLKQYPDDWFNGGSLEIISGTNEGESRDISDFARSTGTVTVGLAFASAIDTTSVYIARRSWASLIRQAFEDVKWKVRQRGLRAALIIDSGELYLPILYHAIQLCYEALSAMRGEDPREGAYWQRALEYEGKYERSFDSISFHYDTGDDAVPDSTVSFSSVRARRR